MASQKVQIKISAEAREAINVLNQTGKSLIKFGNNAQKIGQGLNATFAPLMRVMAGVGASLTAATAALAGAALNIGGSFEDAMLKVKGVAGATDEEFTRLIEKARQLGADLPITAQQAAQAMYSMASAGMSVQEILDAINGIVNLSISQGYDLAATTDVVVSTLSSFGMTADEAGRVADVFSNAISSSQLNMEKLGYAMRYAAPIANSLGLSIEQTVAAMEALANAGLKGEQIGTYLRGILTVFVDPSTDAKAALDALGVSLRDAGGRVRNFVDILKDMKAAGAGAEDFATIFGRELSAAGAILVTASDRLQEFEQGLHKAGRTQELLNEQMASFQNIVKSAKSAMEENLLVIFDGIQDRAKGFVSGLRQIAQEFARWNKETQATSKIIQAFFEGLGLGAVSVDSVREKLEQIDVEKLSEKFAKFGEGIAAFLKSLKDLAEKIPWGMLAEHLDEITTVIVVGWAAGKIATIAGSITILGQAFLRLATAVKTFATASAMANAGGLIGSGGPLIATLSGFSAALAGAVAIIAATPEKIDETTESMDDLQAAIHGDIEALKKLPSAMQEWIKQTYLLKDAQKEAEQAGSKIQQIADRLKEMPQEFASVVASVADVYEQVGDAADRIMRQFGDEVKEYLSKRGKEGAEELAKAFEGASAKVQSIVKKVIEDAQKQIDAGQVQPPATYSDQITASIRQALREFAIYAVDIIEKTKEIKDTFGLTGKEAGEALNSALSSKLQQIASGLVTKFNNPALKTAFMKAFQNLADSAGSPFLRALGQYMQQATGMVENAVKSIDEQLQDALSAAKQQYGGEWTVSSVISEDATQKVVQITNGVVYLGEVLQKAQQSAQSVSFDALARSAANIKPQIENILGNIDTSKMTQDVSRALNTLQGPAQTAGAAVGNSLYAGIMAGIDKAIAEAKRKIASLNMPAVGTAGGSVTSAMRGEL
jgi:TP901 family phage tail tape measure protein